MNDSGDIVIGIDGGGTTTRAMISDLSGQVLSYVEKGAASFHKDITARENVREAIVEALASAKRKLGHVRAVAAGIAGYDKESDLTWVASLTDVEGLDCPKWHYNDTVAALYGSFIMKPGIVAISGTGSIIAAITETGEYVRNYDFHHYASSAARFIAYETVYEALAGKADRTDELLVQDMLRHWGVETLADFYHIARIGFNDDVRERNKQFGQFAPAVTNAALEGSAIARRVCDKAIEELRTGIQLIGASFTSNVIQLAFIGSVINSKYFDLRLRELLASSGSNKVYEVVAPKFDPVIGSLLYAHHQINRGRLDEVVSNLEKYNF